MIDPKTVFSRPGRALIAGAPEGHTARVLAALANGGRTILMVARDDVALARHGDALDFFAPGVERLEFPAWDCLPYDRVSPNAAIVSRRVDTLTRLLADTPAPTTGRIVVATVSAVLQRVAPKSAFTGATLALRKNMPLAQETLIRFLESHGYGRAATVMEPGEYAVRGGIVDVFAPGRDEPVRIDFFGDEIDAIRAFDATSQRTTGQLDELVFKPVSEVPLDKDAVARFRTGYREGFGVTGDDDPLYEAVSAGHRHAGMEHWIALFHERMETLFDYASFDAVVLDHQTEEAVEARLDLIQEYYAARRELIGVGIAAGGVPYHPVPPERTYLGAEEWRILLGDRPVGQFTPFAAPEGPAEGFAAVVDAGGRSGRDFAEARVTPGANVFDAVAHHLIGLKGQGKTVIFAAFTEGSRERLASVLHEHGTPPLPGIGSAAEAEALGPGAVVSATIGLERGFVADNLVVVTEQDILGERLIRPTKRRIKAENFIAEASSLNEGDLVVHVNHGIGRYDGLEAVEVHGAPHDCLRLIYDGGDKLYLPVENIELVSRFGSDETEARLDKLGGAAWQARKARLKARIRDMADELIKIAAARTLKSADALTPPEGVYDEFCARFPYAETEDQQRAIAAAIDDLAAGRPTDRLVCGDVGFGKTEVALRAAFVAAMAGRQVAVVVPTTLLCRQHFQTFSQRFDGFPVKVAQVSRLVTAKDAAAVKAGLADGSVDIVVGTHALLAKDVKFHDLGLLVVDEEQHFGVAHKERLKRLKADVHVLTLSATPIPRTLQLALTGLRELSLIATPPVDRLAVRTFVLPYDPVIVREAIMRERYRGGQTFYVCPRIEDLAGVAERLAELVPEIKMIAVHGRMPPKDLEKAITAFYDGAYDLLLATNIIESGLDLPAVNTIVIHRADMFGLAQLYQLRGRVGRAKVRAYAYLTLPPKRKLTAAAEKRLEVMQTLDTLGAGFSLASHDLDIRGAGNLLGEEQSGHIKEVGIELYQQMLEEAVAEARGLDAEEAETREWSPQISIGMAVLIPEPYVPDLAVRMGLYRRLSRIDDAAEIDAFAAELIDRFGPLPPEVDNLLATVAIKKLCRDAGVEKVEVGPKGATVGFRNQRFANPAGLVDFIQKHAGTVKLRPDHRLVFMRSWDDAGQRLKGVQYLLKELAGIAGAGQAAGA